jgi:organic hydroperoxide reductase OsmC/OhrA
MHPLPHRYTVTAAGQTAGDIELFSPGLVPLRSAAPPEFDGPLGRWSPETLLIGAIGDCYVLTFRSIAAASQLPWTSLRCDVTGVLDRVDGILQFTRANLRATLEVSGEVDADRTRRILEKAERHCLITNSLSASIELEIAIVKTVDAPAGALMTA